MLYGTKNQRAILAADLRADDRRAADRARRFPLETPLEVRADGPADARATNPERFVLGRPAPRPVLTSVWRRLPRALVVRVGRQPWTRRTAGIAAQR
jgi:hypothetical protein